MYLHWPASAVKEWPEQRDGDGELLFRGPRSVRALGASLASQLPNPERFSVGLACQIVLHAHGCGDIGSA
jgi:hypothetical protein